MSLKIPLWRWHGTRTGHAALVLAMLYATVSLVCSARPEDALIRVGDIPLDDSGQPVRIHLNCTQLPAYYQTLGSVRMAWPAHVDSSWPGVADSYSI